MIHSYSSISAYENCPWAFHDRYVLRNKYPDTPQQAAGTATHLALQRRLEDRRSLPAELASIEPLVLSLERKGAVIAERKLGVTRDMQGCDFFDKEGWVRGVLDVLLYGHGTAVNADWKTGKPREDDLQLLICAILLMTNFEQIQDVVGFNIWLRTGKPGTPHRWTRAELPAMLARLVALTDPIDTAIAEGRFPARPSPLCKWCPVAECKERRHAYAP